MKSRSEIQFDFEQALRRADEVEEIADGVERLAARDLDEVNDRLAGYWKGENARLFQNKAHRLQTEVRKSATKIREIAISIRTTAKIIYDAEMEAKRIADQRNHNGSFGGGGGGGGFRY